MEGVGVYVKEHPPLHLHSPREIKSANYIYFLYRVCGFIAVLIPLIEPPDTSIPTARYFVYLYRCICLFEIIANS